MRMAFFLLGLFFVFVSVRGRDLTTSERLLLLPYENNTKNVRQYFLDNIETTSLSWSQWLAYKGLERSCDPLNLHLSRIAREEEEYPDQTENLKNLYSLCSEGVLNLANLYIKGQ